MKSKYTQVNGIRLHYLDNEASGPVLILLHGLTANCHAFDGLLSAGLGQLGRIISVDLRGRGLSDQPEQDYSMPTHARDIVELIKKLNLNDVILLGHSFGALMSWYLADMIPERIKGIVFMDAAAKLHPETKDMLIPTMSRLGKEFKNINEYLDWAKSAPYLEGTWNQELESYFKADIKQLANGKVMPISKPATIAEAVTGALGENWEPLIKKMKKPALLIHAPGPYDLERNAPLLPFENAIETVNWMSDCQYVKVSGNHQTMLYGEGASQIVQAIKIFISLTS
jgi:pimeloyl-ACP methyl ester carboxylesterase